MLYKHTNLPSAALSPIGRPLLAECPASLAYALAALLALLFTFQLYPLSFLGGSGSFFELKDAPQHVTGWLFYLRDSWHFPLLHTERLNHPEGVNIAFTDSIPLAALFFKIIGGLLPAQFNYFGLWHGVALLGQALGAVFLLRALGVRHLAGALIASGFALLWPALLWRFEHTALMTHALILFALGLYFIGRSGQWRSRTVCTAFIALSVIGLLVHPYFLAFGATLFLVYLADSAVAGAGWKRQAPPLFAWILVLALTGALFGYFGNGTQTFGFDTYSMNLTAPFCGSRFYSCVSAGVDQPFKAFHFFDATGGQYEGYNYFGLGALLLLPFALAAGWSTLRSLPRKYPFLLAALVLLTLYALSNKIFFNSHALVSYSVPAFMDRLTGTFRASGRFFWIVGYVILFASLAALLRKPSLAKIALLICALALQWVDLEPLRRHNTETASRPGAQDLAQWAPALQNVDKLFLYPAFGCKENDPRVYLLFQRVAAQYGKLIDTGYIARPNVNCEKNALSFDAEFKPRELVVMASAELKTPLSVPGGFQRSIRRGECVTRAELLLCQAGTTAAQWRASGLTGLEPVGTDFGIQRWNAAKLSTLLGKVVGDRLVPQQTDKVGVLSFGPYVALHAGRYRMRLRYASDAEETRQVGRWDIVGNRSKAPTLEVDGGSLTGTRGAVREIDTVFSSTDSTALFEIRTIFSATGDLQVLDLSIERTP